jgi:predicted ATP-dependent endonuclease of OLD family
MKIIKSVEIGYFRSLYKERINDVGDLTVIFGRNDSGKSNILRALNLFFNQQTNPNANFDFDIDFNHHRRLEGEKEGVRKFIYIKVTFSPPANYRASLGEEFSVKRQWNISSGLVFHQEISRNVPQIRHQYVTRLLNQIQFHYIPAIKDRRIFSWLFQKIYGIIVSNVDFSKALDRFSKEIQENTGQLFSDLEPVLGFKSELAAPKNLTELFGALDVDTMSDDNKQSLSLILQRGDGLQVRHIPEILKFIADNDDRKFHIWGFEEPENSLELAAAFDEAKRFVEISKDSNKQLFVTSHSPSFFTIEEANATKLFVSKNQNLSKVQKLSGNSGEDALELMGDNFYLPLISRSVQKSIEEVAALKDGMVSLNKRLAVGVGPILFVEGVTDKAIVELAYRKLRDGAVMPCTVEAGSGTQKMKALRADGPALSVAASGRKILVLTDNDFDGRELSSSKSAGKWESSNNKTSWWMLKPSTVYSDQMAAVNFGPNMHFFCIEDCFSMETRLAAQTDIKEIASSYKYNAPRQYPVKIHHDVLIGRASEDVAFKFAINGPTPEAKDQFVVWLEDRPVADFEYFREFFSQLELRLKV